MSQVFGALVFFTTSEAAADTHYTRQAVANLVKRGAIRAVKDVKTGEYLIPIFELARLRSRRQPRQVNAEASFADD